MKNSLYCALIVVALLLHHAEACGVDIAAEEGVIQSPNYPNAYGPNGRCTWTIQVPENYTVSLRFLTFDVDCTDRVEVNDKVHDRLLLGKCGHRIPVPLSVFSYSNEIEVLLVTDGDHERKGFIAEFRKVETCGSRIVAEEGIIQSPNYPDNYQPGQRCTWTIIVPEGKQVRLNFLTFDVVCDGDIVKFYDWSFLESSGDFCGHDVPSPILSRRNELEVLFLSDASEVAKGFSAEFKAVEPSCGGNIVADEGVIRSPNYPEAYEPNGRCTWIIKVPENYKVSLRFLTFEVDCTDHVLVVDKVQNEMLVLMCGPTVTVPYDVLSYGNEIEVFFATDSEQERKGFIAEFAKVPTTVV